MENINKLSIKKTTDLFFFIICIIFIVLCSQLLLSLLKPIFYGENIRSFNLLFLSVFTVILPSNKQTGDFVELHDAESTWDINNLMVATQNNEQFKNFSGVIDSPLACDVDGATVNLVWTSTYWRVFA